MTRPRAMPLGRRAVLAGGLALGTLRGARAAAAGPAVRLGILPFGAVQWIADVIARHGLDAPHGFSLGTVRLANTEAAKVALLGGAVDVAFSDWPFVASQRAHGGRLCLAAGGSASLGGLMVPAGSAIRGLPDLRGRRLGVAGGGADKSWLVVQVAARRAGLDLSREATLSFGAPPLLDAAMRHGDLDAVLTSWTFAARLEAAGLREVVSVADCAHQLGLPGPPVLLGYVFNQDWAEAHRAVIGGFLAASAEACALLASSADEWQAVRRLMDARDDALFAALRRRFLAGLGTGDTRAMQAQAVRLQALLAAGDGSTGAQAGSARLPRGVFWSPADAG